MKNKTILIVYLFSILLFSCRKIESCESIFNTKPIPLVTKIAFGSCGSQNDEQPILNTILSKNPNVFIYLGDNIYGDTKYMPTLEHEYYKLCSKSEFQNLIKSTRVIATWDDHDYGENDSGKNYPKKDESKKIFLKFWGEPFGSQRWSRPGIYTSYYFGDTAHLVQIILLDCRTFRDDLLIDNNGNYLQNNDSTATMLGTYQWNWLKSELQKPAKIRIIGSSTQVLRSYNAMEAWANYPHEQQKMLQLVQQLQIKNLFFISGDVHLAELSKIAMNNNQDVYDFTASGLTNSKVQDVDIPNSNRVGNSVYNTTNFGFIQIDWNQQPVKVSFKIFNEAGAEKYSHDVYY